VEESEIDRISKSLRFLENETVFKIEINRLGYFGSPNYIRVVWLGIGNGEGKMKELLKRVNENVKFGEKNDSPHLTIGRIKAGKNRAALLKFIDENEKVKIGEMTVNEMQLKMSVLGRVGPTYKNMYIFRLGQK
jgi:2'-5' RNA ligase